MTASDSSRVGRTGARLPGPGPLGVMVNAVPPGPMVDDGVRDPLGDEEREEVTTATALRRAGTPQEVARIMAWLASDASSLVASDVVTVSGGYYHHP